MGGCLGLSWSSHPHPPHSIYSIFHFHDWTDDSPNFFFCSVWSHYEPVTHSYTTHPQNTFPWIDRHFEYFFIFSSTRYDSRWYDGECGLVDSNKFSFVSINGVDDSSWIAELTLHNEIGTFTRIEPNCCVSLAFVFSSRICQPIQTHTHTLHTQTNTNARKHIWHENIRIKVNRNRIQNPRPNKKKTMKIPQATWCERNNASGWCVICALEASAHTSHRRKYAPTGAHRSTYCFTYIRSIVSFIVLIQWSDTRNRNSI